MDLDKDGKDEIVVSSWDGHVSLYHLSGYFINDATQILKIQNTKYVR